MHGKAHALVTSFLLVFLSLPLLSCGGGGGGGSATGGGGTGPGPGAGDPIPPGSYSGTVSLEGSGPGGSASTSQPMTVVVAADNSVGQNTHALVGPNYSCTNPGALTLSTNPYTYTIAFDCTVSGVGSCTITDQGTFSVSGDTLAWNGRMTFDCGPLGTAVVTYDFSGTRTAQAGAAAAGVRDRRAGALSLAARLLRGG